jgi:hypothetical protein
MNRMKPFGPNEWRWHMWMMALGAVGLFFVADIFGYTVQTVALAWGFYAIGLLVHEYIAKRRWTGVFLVFPGGRREINITVEEDA